MASHTPCRADKEFSKSGPEYSIITGDSFRSEECTCVATENRRSAPLARHFRDEPLVANSETIRRGLRRSFRYPLWPAALGLRALLAACPEFHLFPGRSLRRTADVSGDHRGRRPCAAQAYCAQGRADRADRACRICVRGRRTLPAVRHYAAGV